MKKKLFKQLKKKVAKKKKRRIVQKAKEALYKKHYQYAEKFARKKKHDVFDFSVVST